MDATLARMVAGLESELEERSKGIQSVDQKSQLELVESICARVGPHPSGPIQSGLRSRLEPRQSRSLTRGCCAGTRWVRTRQCHATGADNAAETVNRHTLPCESCKN